MVVVCFMFSGGVFVCLVVCLCVMLVRCVFVDGLFRCRVCIYGLFVCCLFVVGVLFDWWLFV